MFNMPLDPHPHRTTNYSLAYAQILTRNKRFPFLTASAHAITHITLILIVIYGGSWICGTHYIYVRVFLCGCRIRHLRFVGVCAWVSGQRTATAATAWCGDIFASAFAGTGIGNHWWVPIIYKIMWRFDYYTGFNVFYVFCSEWGCLREL